MNPAEKFDLFVFRWMLKQDAEITATFEADRLALGGRVAMLSGHEDALGAKQMLDFYTEVEQS